MKKNMGTADRIIRAIFAALILILYFTKVIDGILCLVLLVVAAILTLTSIERFCPLYSIFGLSTRPRRKRSKK